MKESPENWHKNFPLPSKLRISPEKQAEIDEQQKVWSENAASPFAARTPAEFERSRALILVKELEEALSNFKIEFGRAEENDKPQWVEAINITKSKLAENYAQIGRYDSAARYEPDEVKRKEYLDILEAINREDSEWCECGKNGILPTTYVKQEIFSFKHNKVMPLLACSTCGTLNVAPMPKEQSRLREARRRARALVGNADKNTAREILRSHKHTTREIIK